MAEIDNNLWCPFCLEEHAPCVDAPRVPAFDMFQEVLILRAKVAKLEAQLDAIYALPAVGHVTSSPNIYGANIIDGLQNGIYLFALPPRREV
jgi:hypothetical protein